MNLSGVDNLQYNTSGLDELLKQVQSVQDAFCRSNHIYGCCYLKNYGFATEVSNDAEVRSFLDEHFPNDKRIELTHMFSDGDLENVITQYLEDDYYLMQGIAIRGVDGSLIGVWIMMVVLVDRMPMGIRLPQNLMTRAIDGLDDVIMVITSMTSLYISERTRSNDYRDNLGQLEVSEKQMQIMLNRSAVMTDILRQLEVDADFAKVTEDILRDAGDYLNITDSCLLRINQDEETVDMVAEYCRDSKYSMISSFYNVPKATLPFMTGRPFTISSEALIPDDFMDFFSHYNISAGLFLPVMVNGRDGMYLCFMMKGEPRKWSVEEVKFLNDVKKVVQSILSKRITKNSLASSYETIEQVLENAGCGIVVLDLERNRFLYTNETFREMIYEESDRYELDGILLHADDIFHDKMEYQALREKRWFEVSFGVITWIDGRQVRLCTLYDITDSKNYQKRIEHQASIDYMTGLLNRKRMEMDLQAEVRTAGRLGGSGAFIYMDLDDFKNINDGLGHEAGDQLLQKVAAGLERIAGARINTYRVGGDEFAMVIPYDKYSELATILNKFNELFKSPWRLDGKDYYCTVSAGIAIFPKDGNDVNMLIKRADYALRQAKNNGKGHLEYYSDESSESSMNRLEMERALRQAVEDGCHEFEVYYQPMVDVTKEDHPCCGAEALVRWNSPSLGFVMPSDFVPLAEYLGLIIPIGEHVLYKAAERCRYWNDYGHPEFKVNVNLSVVQLIQDGIVDTVRTVIQRTGINPRNLTLEVTESLAVNDLESMSNVLNSLRGLGVRVALDDFGTGYSSLSYIRNLPLDSIKIDKSFVNHVGEDEFSNAFVETVSKLADTIDVNVVVEGVEEPEQQAALLGMDIDVIQGYLYDKPLPQDEFEDKYLK